MVSITIRGDGLERLAGQMDEAVEVGLDAAAELVMQAKERELRKTYARPIPTSATGRRKWERSGDLLSSQRITKRKGERVIEPTGQPAKYEGRLAELKTERRNPAAQNALQSVEPQMAGVVEAAMRRNLGL